MKIDEIIFKLNYEIEKHYGLNQAVHTVIMNHEAFDQTITSLWESANYKDSFTPSGINDFTITGVRILARSAESK